MRVVLGILAAALAAFFAGVIMGEYELRGSLAYVAGALFGLAIAEAAITAGASRSWALAAPAALFAAAGLTWAAKIDAGGRWADIATPRWIGSALAAVAAAWWVRKLGGRATSSSPPTTPA